MCVCVYIYIYMVLWFYIKWPPECNLGLPSVHYADYFYTTKILILKNENL